MAAADRKERIAAAKAELQSLKVQLEATLQARAGNVGVLARSQGVSRDGLPKLAERKRLYGHYGKVYAMSWAGDSQQMVSARCVAATALPFS